MNPFRLLSAVAVFALLAHAAPVGAQPAGAPTRLTTEYLATPLGIDIAYPRFAWQMTVPDGRRGARQTAYRIVVEGPGPQRVWDSGRTERGTSLGIRYAGTPLQPATRYTWTVTVWDDAGNDASATSWFETGLMNPDPGLSAWEGGRWIGGGDDDLVFYAPYLSVYTFRYTLQLDRPSGSTRAGFVFGANDPRLMDADLNIQGVQNGKDESYVAFELDISGIDGTEEGLAQLHIYRAGYHPSDRADVPFRSLPIPRTLIDAANRYEPHLVFAKANFGLFEIFVNGRDDAHRITVNEDPNPGPFSSPSINLNPVGSGNNYISFPMVADVGFYAAAGQRAAFSDLAVMHFRSPSNDLFHEHLTDEEGYDGIFQLDDGLTVAEGAYAVDGGRDGFLRVADPSRNAMPMLRTEFDVADRDVTAARLYVTARGIYEMYLNGERVGDDVFNPGLTQYNVTHMYQTYDVTDAIRPGARNALGGWLGEGWWSGNITFSGQNWNYFGDRQSLLAKLVVTYADGTRDVVATRPEAWRSFNDGPIRYGSFFQGEVYDGTREAAVDGWTLPGYDDSAWKPAADVPLDGTTYLVEPRGNAPGFHYDDLAMVGQLGENARVVMTLEAQSVEEVRPGVFVYDMGQNMVGIPRIRIDDGRPGQRVVLRFAEMRYPSLPEHAGDAGMIMLENIRAALAQDVFTLRGGEQILEPRFTFHGYRYLEISGIDAPVPLADVKGRVVSSIGELASGFESANPLVDRLWQNITWSMRGNFLSIPTDTPARNERMGWGGDISVFGRSATYLAPAGPFLRRHMLAMRDLQRADGRFTDVAPVGGGFGGILWGSAGITVAWEGYLQYGDLDMLAEHYPAMARYMDYLATRIDPETGMLSEGPLGDWLSPENGKNDNSMLWEAYYIYDLGIVARTAALLGRPTEAAAYAEQRRRRKAHFNRTYVNPSTGQTIASGVASGGFGGGRTLAAGDLVDTQVSYAVPLALDAFDDAVRPLAARNLAATVRRANTDDRGVERPPYSLMTGFIGTAWISMALSDAGFHDAAFRLLQQTSYPSWLYPVRQGATTIWERLNSYTAEDGFGGNNSMNSFNHYSFGAVGAWMYSYLLGIARDEAAPGFRHFVLQPTPDPDARMTHASGHYDAMYGRIESAWRIDGDRVEYTLTVPANTTATLRLLAPSQERVAADGGPAAAADGVTFVRQDGDRAVFELVSGTYAFTAPRPAP